jgi:hypothetical protein
MEVMSHRGEDRTDSLELSFVWCLDCKILCGGLEGLCHIIPLVTGSVEFIACYL